MYYANYNESTGEILGFYSDEIHKEIPTPHIELTDEEWQQAVNGSYRIINGVLTAYVPEITTADKIMQAQAEYGAKFAELRKQYAVAELNDNAESMEAIKGKNIVLKNDFINYIAWLKGEAPRDTGAAPEVEDYCPICGSALSNNVCPQCRYRKL